MIEDKKKLLKNTFMLYILRFSTYFFSFITVPYQTRILGAEIYGKTGLATALMVYFQLFIDFGFILSATERTVRNRKNIQELCEIHTSVLIIKIMFSIISILGLFLICMCISQYRLDFVLFFLFLLWTVINSFIPDFLYRGIEDMSAITYRTLFVRAFFTIMIFVFLKTPSDYYCIPILNAMGSIIALIWSLYDINKRYRIHVVTVRKEKIIGIFKESSHFFLSRIASTMYSALNTLILGFMSPTAAVIGYYTAAYKLISTGQSALSPISDSIYPYMIKNKDFKILKKTLYICMPVIILFSIIIFFNAEWFCTIIFGEDYILAAPILKSMMPIAIITLPDYIFGFPALGAIGLSKHANYSIYLSSIFHFICLLFLCKMNYLSAITLTRLTSVSMSVELLYRIFVTLKNKKKFIESN